MTPSQLSKPPQQPLCQQRQQCRQYWLEDLIEIGEAFGVRMLGAALVVNFGSAAMIREGAHSGPLSSKSIESNMTTKAAPSIRTPKAVAIRANGD